MDDDDEVFRAAMTDVARLNVAPKPAKPRTGPTLGQRAHREQAECERRAAVDPNYLTLGEVKQLAPHELVSWKKDGVQEGVFRKLRLGEYPLEGRLDLHRKTVKEARDAVFDFIQHGSCERLALRADQSRSRRTQSDAGADQELRDRMARADAGSAGLSPSGTPSRWRRRVYVLLRKSPAKREENRERHGQKDTPSRPFGFSDTCRR